MDVENSTSNGPKVNSLVIARKNEIKSFFDAKETMAKLQPYFENNQYKLEQFKQTLVMIAMDDRYRFAEPVSILKCGLQAAQLGLPLEPTIGQVFMVVYDGKLQLSVSYKGWQALFDKDRKSVKAHSVYKCDQFEMAISDHNEHYTLIEAHDQRKESSSKWVLENLKGVVVSVLNVDTNVTMNKFVSADKLLQMRAQSPAIKKDKFSAWTNWTAEMMRAKAIKYFVSKTAMSKRVATAVDIESKNEMITQGLPVKKSFLELDSIDQPERTPDE